MKADDHLVRSYLATLQALENSSAVLAELTTASRKGITVDRTRLDEIDEQLVSTAEHLRRLRAYLSALSGEIHIH